MPATSEYLKNTLRRAKEKYHSEGLVHIVSKIPIVLSRLFDILVLDVKSKFSSQSTREVEFANKSQEELANNFVKDDEASKLLHGLIEEHSDANELSDLTVLEVGCNAGRRANHLHNNGVTDIYGVEINEDAISLLEDTFPDLAEDIETRVGPAQDVLSQFDDNQFDVVYSVSVLMHIWSNQEELFDEIARVSNNLVVTFECENSDEVLDRVGIDERTEEWHEHRNYLDVFEPRGFNQVDVIRGWDTNDPRSDKLQPLKHPSIANKNQGAHTARVLQKRE